jgi:hypothetical protein
MQLREECSRGKERKEEIKRKNKKRVILQGGT